MRRPLILCAALALCATAVALAQGEGATPPTISTPPGPPVAFTIAASGDVLIHSPVWAQAQRNAGGRGYDFAPMLREIRPYVHGADLALCQLETPVTERAPQGYPVFTAPVALARAIQVSGWDVCFTASNHTLDLGQWGIDRTIAALRRHGVDHVGSARSARDARRIPIHTVQGIPVATLAYTQVSNGQREPHPWSLAEADPERIIRDARRARAMGAQAVIVNVHWGEEYQHQPSAAQWQLVRRLARSGQVTAVVGQHAHVVQPIRRVDGMWVVFGEGNLISNQSAGAGLPAASQDGYIARLHLVAQAGRVRVERVSYVPTYVRRPDYAVVPVGARSARAEYRASYHRTRAVAGAGPHLRPVSP